MARRQPEPLVELHDAEPAEERGLGGAPLGQVFIRSRRGGTGHDPQQEAGLSADGRRDARGGAAAHLFVISRDLDAHEGSSGSAIWMVNVTRVAGPFPWRWGPIGVGLAGYAAEGGRRSRLRGPPPAGRARRRSPAGRPRRRRAPNGHDRVAELRCLRRAPPPARLSELGLRRRLPRPLLPRGFPRDRTRRVPPCLSPARVVRGLPAYGTLPRQDGPRARAARGGAEGGPQPARALRGPARGPGGSGQGRRAVSRRMGLLQLRRRVAAGGDGVSPLPVLRLPPPARSLRQRLRPVLSRPSRQTRRLSLRNRDKKGG